MRMQPMQQLQLQLQQSTGRDQRKIRKFPLETQLCRRLQRHRPPLQEALLLTAEEEEEEEEEECARRP